MCYQSSLIVVSQIGRRRDNDADTHIFTELVYLEFGDMNGKRFNFTKVEIDMLWRKAQL